MVWGLSGVRGTRKMLTSSYSFLILLLNLISYCNHVTTTIITAASLTATYTSNVRASKITTP
jgi:hypothetical protein